MYHYSLRICRGEGGEGVSYSHSYVVNLNHNSLACTNVHCSSHSLPLSSLYPTPSGRGPFLHCQDHQGLQWCRSHRDMPEGRDVLNRV